MTIHGDGTEEKPIKLEDALNEVSALANRVGSQHMILGAALVLLVRCAPLGRGVQHRLLTAAAAMVEITEAALRKAA